MEDRHPQRGAGQPRKSGGANPGERGPISEPIRTCIACRSRRPQRDLLRLSIGPDGGLALNAKSPQGRSFYICPGENCRRAVHARSASRALRQPVSGEVLEAAVQSTLCQQR
ncbi:MAG: YlxR family protein [Armatimonadetes bacterium]|nr:YlxR family protein [Armatimonadota bacterium]MBS1711627.1 YlxR family protein [Armatimonadota bacterium]MBX3109818.1 YlxR family protein [Fimbriimonadaceae bacterium]